MAEFFPSKQFLRCLMLYEFHKNNSATTATKNICDVYGDKLSVRTCQQWFKKFKSGNLSLDDDPRTGRPTTLDDTVLQSEIESNPEITIEELSERLQCPWSTVQEHLKKIGKVWRQGVWVPHDLTEENKMVRVNMCASLKLKVSTDPFLKQIITGDEKWILYDNRKRQNQWLSPNQKAKPTPKPSLTTRKVLLCVWWDYKGIIYYELLKPGQTVNSDVYCEQLDRLSLNLIKKRPELANRGKVILQHDNARPHVAKKTRKKISELGWEVLPHPPYSPDIAPSDYHLFRSLEHFLRNKKHRDGSQVKTTLEEFFSSKTLDFYKSGIFSLPDRWESVINLDGNYIT